MKNAILIHGWGGNQNKDWFPWARVELEQQNINVVTPEMPETDSPKIEPWINILDGLKNKITKNDFFIGHSIGCQTILRFLERQDDNFKIDKLILIAPWWFLNLETDEEKEIALPWLDTFIDFEKVKNKVNKIVCVFSDDDPVVPLNENVNFFKEKLNPEVLIKNKMGHFTEDEGVTKLPWLVDLIN